MYDQVFKTIYIGSMDALNPAAAELFGFEILPFDAAVRLDQISILSSPSPDTLDALELPIDDGQPVPDGIFPQVTQFIQQHVAAGDSVLVQCQAGISRSVTMVLAYLIEYEKMSLEEAFRLIYEQRPGSRPHKALLKSLIEHYDLPYDPRTTENPAFFQNLLGDD